ncbi:MAG: hypothetical protein IJD93_01840 [Ruminococcus sp.]|nr:hypothetical protein [Ruminococcus sp.]
MKKCEYCAKEISYHDLYCCEDCENKATEYFAKRAKLQALISAVNIVGTCIIAVGIFLFAITNLVGALLMATGSLSVGIMTLLLPCPTDNMIKKNKLKKAMSFVRLFSIVLFAFGIGALIVALI